MEKTSIIGIDIEDYYGNAIENIEFINEIEIDLEEFNVRVPNFSFSGIYEEDGEVIARLQYELEGKLDEEEVNESHSEIMDIILESADNQLENGKKISKKILQALELLMLK